MAAVSTILVFDSGLRGAAAVLLLLIGGSLVRDYGKSPAARLGAAFAIGVAAYVFCSAPGFSITENSGTRRSWDCVPETS